MDRTEWKNGGVVSLPKPYYQDEAVTIYCGDAAAILPDMAGFVLVTDPPYGVNLGATKGTGGKHGMVRPGYIGMVDTYEEWTATVLPVIRLAVQSAKRAAVFTGPHLQEQPKATAIGGIYCSAGCGRHAWGFKTFLPVLFYGTAPNLQNGAKPNTIASNARAEANGHPCPKPLEWMTWLVGLCSEPGDLILDPFAGSGTTAVAAKSLGRKCVCVEREERYCEIAAKRIARGAGDAVTIGVDKVVGVRRGFGLR